MKKKIVLRPEIIQQLLFTKELLSEAQFSPEANPSPFSIAKKILSAHDAAELGIAAVADQLGAMPHQNKRFLLDYFTSIKEKKHPRKEVDGKEYFRQLNEVRINLKHGMILPDSGQWAHVLKRVFVYLSGWCKLYLNLSLDDLDSSILINDPNVKRLFDEAKGQYQLGNYQKVLEHLGKAACLLFDENNALRSLQVGTVKAEDAIKLAAFGVHANDFLALQQFLPVVYKSPTADFSIKWKQEEFGHPGNWDEVSAKFCIDAFLDLALKIQDAEWIPGPIDFLAIYEHRVEALVDGVQISSWGPGGQQVYSPPDRKIIKVLNKGDSIRGMVKREERSMAPSLSGLLGQPLFGFGLGETDKKSDEISIVSRELPDGNISGYIALKDIKITCVPKKRDFVKKHFPDLPEMEMQLE